GVPLSSIPASGSLLGYVGDDAVLLVRHGAEVFAIGAECTHYGGPLAEGIVADGTVRCPWHHACFDVRTGAAVGAPALGDLPCWSVERRGGDRVHPHLEESWLQRLDHRVRRGGAWAGRSPEPLEGLSRGHRAGGVD